MRADSWIVTDGARGNEKQCLALAHYLAHYLAQYLAKSLAQNPSQNPAQNPAHNSADDQAQDSTPIRSAPSQGIQRIRLALSQPWGALSPRLLWGAGHAFKPAVNSDLKCLNPAALETGPLPALVISCGRRAALAARFLKQRGGRSITTIQILNPRIATRHFDWVICPRHDQLSGDNVITTQGALHNVDDHTLSAARVAWSHLEELSAPRVAVLIGASNGAYVVDESYLEQLLAGASQLAGEGTLMVTTSRRTPDTLQAFTRSWLQRHHPQRFLFHADQPGQPNPYSGLLAHAQRIVVSSDSVNMISEALGTGSPVHCPTAHTSNQRFSRFQSSLIDSGRLLSLHDHSRPAYPPLRETQGVAKTIADSISQSLRPVPRS